MTLGIFASKSGSIFFPKTLICNCHVEVTVVINVEHGHLNIFCDSLIILLFFLQTKIFILFYFVPTVYKSKKVVYPYCLDP
jgi:hypothetical protein